MDSNQDCMGLQETYNCHYSCSLPSPPIEHCVLEKKVNCFDAINDYGCHFQITFLVIAFWGEGGQAGL